ncbi:MAG TPA: efflux RND transporter periplasmic adaptor subunit [Phenylobacterium sp.]|jgi:macrolide-specific efflux system membrane fusion protein|uniref:efflux RND transporter periplasmic adaptor subunit n=1 Tax=Phenylobacterium sp. TaxID=1871053 RepID=UPI002D21F941|nr:efflux RND transporter periplasmic adaptor subunit [Phenylobacterium sp.]HZZ67094.1 efflux RND transporter periplasmic adaptor subunit [Phenylobacterium sp.]
MATTTLKRRPYGRYAAIGIAVLVVLFVLKGCFFPTVAPPRYITAPATVGDVEQTVLASGALQPFELVDVGAQVSGQVKSLKVALGDKVVKGQLIASIDPATQRNALLTAQATLEQQKAQRLSQEALVAQDRLSLARQTTTFAAEASSRQDLEAAQAALKSAEANLAATNALIKQAVVAVDTAGVNLGYTQIVAPIDGVVVAIQTKQGQTVNAVQSAPTIVKLADLATMTVKAQISEADVVRVHPGQVVYFTILGEPDRRFYAHLRAIEPAPDSITSTTTATASPATTAAVYYNGLFEVANPDGVLRTSMTAQVYIVLASARHVLTVPSAALTPTGKGYTVRILTDPKKPPQVRAVQVGLNDNVTAEIRGGLKAGEKVIVGEGPAKEATPRPPGSPGGPPARGTVRIGN